MPKHPYKKRLKTDFVRWIVRNDEIVGLHRALDGRVITASGFCSAEAYERMRAVAPSILPRHCDLPIITLPEMPATYDDQTPVALATQAG